MRFLLGSLLFLSFPLWAQSQFCPESLLVKLETGKKVTFCRLEKLMVSWDCYQKKDECSMVKDFNEKKSSVGDPLKAAQTRNPGSWICDKLGQKVIMGKVNDSAICTCQHRSGDSVICTSLIDLVQSH